MKHLIESTSQRHVDRISSRTYGYVHAHALTNGPPVCSRAFARQQHVASTAEFSLRSHSSAPSGRRASAELRLRSPGPSDSRAHFKRSHSVSLSRLRVESLITSDTASCVFMCVDLQYVPRGLSGGESEVQRPPARMLNQS